MELKTGMICKHFKGETLLEKNIYEIIAVNPEYTGTKDFPKEAVVIYKPIFQEGKTFVREHNDLVQELSDEEKLMFHQSYRVEPLTDEELLQIRNNDFIKAKLQFIKEKYKNKKKL